MHKTDNSEWITYVNRDVVPRSTVQGYIQKGFFYKCLLRNISKDLDDFGLLYEPVRRALATRVQMSNLPPLLLPLIAGEYIHARISCIADFDRLFVQLENNARTIIKVGKRLRDLATQKHEPLCNPECGTIIAALYSIDGCYYRASVCSKAGIDSMVVFYIDYGNMASVNINDAFLLKDAYLLSIPPQAVQLIISDVKKPRLTSEQIRNLLIDQTVAAQINDVSENGESFIANLFVKDEKNRNVNLTEVILGERPAPALPAPKPVTIENFLDNEDYYACQNGGWNRVCENNKTSGLKKQSRSGNFSSNFRGNINHNFNDYSGGSATRVDDRRVRRNCGDPGYSTHQCSVYRRSGFANDKSMYDNERRKFVDNDCFNGSSRASSNGTRGPKNSGCFSSGLSESKSRNNFGDRSVRLSGRRDQSPRPFLDRDTHHDDTSADKSGWKSGNWTAVSNINATKSELNCSLNNGFGEKVNKKNDTENWIVNEGGWEINNASCDLLENRNQIEASEKISRNSTAYSARNDFDGVGNDRDAESINAFGVSLQLDLEPDTEVTSGTETTSDGTYSNYEIPIKSNNIHLASNTLTHIESASLEEIKFGDTVGGIHSDNSAEADPLSFFVQLDRDKDNIEHLVLSDAQLSVDLPKLSSFEISQVCIAPFMGNYYRAEIIGIENNTKKRILFVDYGNVEDMETSELLYVINDSLPSQFCTSRRLAFHCRLHGIMPVASKHTFDSEARKLFSELIANQKLSICFMQQSVKGIYEITVMLNNGRFISDILISRGFAVPFKWGIGPSLPLYETLDVLRSDEFDHVRPIFTVQLSDGISQLERLINEYVDSKKPVETPQIGDVVISYFEESPYRAEIIGTEINDDDIAYRVYYVDYGNESLCKKEELFALDRDEQPDEILYTPRQGIRCRIDGVRPLNRKESWPEEVQKCIDGLLSPSTSFEAAVGSPNMDGVFPIRIVVPKKQLNEKNGFEADEVNNVNDKVELASWLITKGYAEMQDIWKDYPVMNLLADGKREYEMFITEVDGQIIRARPCIFAEQYNKMKKSLANIKTVPLVTDATTGLISLNNENKRAMLVSAKNNATSKKCLLVDEGISVEEIPSQFSGINELCDFDGFFVRTCHRLSVELRFIESLLDETLREIIMNSAASDPVKVILVEYNEDNSYIIGDIFFSDGTTLMQKFMKAKREKIDEKGSAPHLVTFDLKQTSGETLNQDGKAIDSRPLNNGMKQIECENLIMNQDSDLKPQTSEISNGIFNDMHKDCKTFDPEITAVLNSLVACVSNSDGIQ
ncbi:Tudor domain family protein [Acanthocheilonema viteae]